MGLDDNLSKLMPKQKKTKKNAQVCTELASIICRIWTFRSLEIGFVIEPNTFIGKPPLEKGNLHESAVRKTIGLSPEGNSDTAAGLPSGSAPKQGLIAHGRRIRHKKSAPIRLIRQRKVSFPANRLLPCLPDLPFPSTLPGAAAAYGR